jgi:hypothetical protein
MASVTFMSRAVSAVLSVMPRPYPGRPSVASASR